MENSDQPNDIFIGNLDFKEETEEIKGLIKVADEFDIEHTFNFDKCNIDKILRYYGSSTNFETKNDYDYLKDI